MSNFNQDFEEMKRKKIKRLIIGYVVGFMVFLMMWNFYNAMRLKNYTDNLKDTISFKIDNNSSKLLVPSSSSNSKTVKLFPFSFNIFSIVVEGQ